jgi:hypothetical protein
MKAVLASAFACQAVYAIYNQNVYDQTAEGFSVSWEDSEDSTAEFYKVSVVDRSTGEEVANDEVGDLEAHFSSLSSATVYDIKIEGFTSDIDGNPISAGGQNQVEARTDGSKAWITGNWTTGAQGMVMWPINSGDTKQCGRAFNFMLPCDNIDLLDLGVGDNVGVEKSSNSSMAIYVGSKANLSYIQWVALGQGCPWDTYTENDFVVESFDGYDSISDVNTEPNVAASWSQTPGKTVNQLIVDITPEQMVDCSPSVEIDIPCEVNHVGGWSMDVEGGYDNNSGVSSFVGSLSNDWINQVGFTYEFADECSHNATVTISYNVRRGN